ncbi:hypothetical protein GGF44_001757 [Coemansia sp. RSA 1694]|nr:hypothetical protein GGH95_002472 [Coemansia sp. RSA 1836]KAJ2642253.1 hypothetical protein GGF44_001757 [Coemansia sp. RSA 1694]
MHTLRKYNEVARLASNVKRTGFSKCTIYVVLKQGVEIPDITVEEPELRRISLIPDRVFVIYTGTEYDKLNNHHIGLETNVVGIMSTTGETIGQEIVHNLEEEDKNNN